MTYEEQVMQETKVMQKMHELATQLKELKSQQYKLRKQQKTIKEEKRAIIKKRPERLKHIVLTKMQAGILYTPTMVNNMFVVEYPDDYTFSVQQLHLAAKKGGKHNRHYTNTDLFAIGLIRIKVGSKYYYKKEC